MRRVPSRPKKRVAWGVVNKLGEAGRVREDTLGAARRIASHAPLSVRQAKHAIREGLQMDLASAMRLEVEAYSRLIGTQDRREGLRAFNEKRQPKFKGR